MKIMILLTLVLASLSFNLVYGQEVNAHLDGVLSNVDKIDSLINVTLLGTLGGMSLASASLLVSSRGQIEQQIMYEEMRLPTEQNNEIRKKLENNLDEIRLKKKYIQFGIQYLVKAFFLFIAELVTLLLFFDSYYDTSSVPEILNGVIIFVFEILPFLVGLGLLIIGAEYVRRAYTK